MLQNKNKTFVSLNLLTQIYMQFSYLMLHNLLKKSTNTEEDRKRLTSNIKKNNAKNIIKQKYTYTQDISTILTLNPIPLFHRFPPISIAYLPKPLLSWTPTHQNAILKWF